MSALFRTKPHPKVASLLVIACEVALRGPAGSLCVTLPCSTSLSGAQYAERLLQATLSPRWPPRQAAGISACLAGGPLTPSLADALAAKVSSALRNAATQDWPVLAHHAWGAAASGGGDAGLALNRVVSMLECLPAQEAAPPVSGAAAHNARCNAQGVVLMTLERDASQPRLGEAFSRACTSGTLCQSHSSLGGQGTMPGPFRCAVLLALARATHSLEEAALAALHEAVVKSFSRGGGRRSDGAGHSPSPWLSSLAVHQGISSGQVGQHPLLEVVAYSTTGWDLIIPSLVALALRMLDALPSGTATETYDPLVDALAAVAAMDAAGGDENVVTMKSLFSAEAQTAALGVHLLLATFKHHDSARRTIIRACATQLAGATTSSGGGGGGGGRGRATSGGLTPTGAVHARLLVALCRAYPAAVTPHAECLRDAFHHAACLSPEVTSALLLCIRPLHALAPQLQEHCALALRKALFDTAPGRAGAAARGVLHQALQATISGGGPGVDADGAGPSQERHPVSLQLGGFLRRCLTQDAAVRRCAYRGLAGLAEADPHGHGAATAASTLLGQLSRYVSHTPGDVADTQGGATGARRRDSIEDGDDDDDDGIQPAFQLAACVTQPAQGDAAAGGASAAAVVVEPFASLLRACWDVTAAVAAAGEGPHSVSTSVVNQLREATWATLHKLLSTCEDSVAWEEAYGVAGATGGGGGQAEGGTTAPHIYDATSAARAQVLCASLQVAIDWALHQLLAARLRLTPDWREALGRAMACHTRMRLRMAAAARASHKKGGGGGPPAPDADDATAADGGGSTAPPATGTAARSGRGGGGAAAGAPRGGGVRRSESDVGMRGASLVALLSAMADPNDLAGILPAAARDKGPFPGAAVVNTATSAQFVVHSAAEALHAGGDSTWLLALATGHADDEAVVRALAPSSCMAATAGHARREAHGRTVAAALLRVMAQLVMVTARGGGAGAPGGDVTPAKGQAKGKSGGSGTGQPGRQPVLVDPPLRVALTAVEAYLRRCASRGGVEGMADAAAALSTAFSTTRRVSAALDSSSSDDEDEAVPVARQKQQQAKPAPVVSTADLAAGLKAGVLKLQSLLTASVGVKAMAKDTAVLLACVGHITAMFARATGGPCTDTANWALKNISNQPAIPDATCAQALAWLAVQLRTPPADANGAKALCDALRTAHGCDQAEADGVSPEADEDDDDVDTKKWAPVQQSLTAGALAVGVLRWADGVLGDVEWLMAVLKAHNKAMEHLGVGLRGAGDDGVEDEEMESDDEDAAQRTSLRAAALAAVKHRRALEDAVCGRLAELVPVVASITGCVVARCIAHAAHPLTSLSVHFHSTKLPLQSCGGAAVKSSTRVMKAVTAIVALSTPGGKKGRKAAKENEPAPPGGGDQGGGRGVVGQACCALVHAVDRELVDTVYAFVQRVEEVRPDQVKEKGAKGKGKKRKGKKQSASAKKKKRKGGGESENEGSDGDSDGGSDDSDAPPAGRADKAGSRAMCSAASLKRVVKQLPGLVFAVEAMRRACVALNAAHGGHTLLLKYAKLLPKRDFKFIAD